ncbi:maltodextrin glucosidase [Streptomyces azureus]|uniref:Maltodextrin glucosidase n=1 Tax=Streptomyces azureus TaxID=146537 RepID=A0A0K8PXF2_STRAJ|nr:maltodextrin glucosidase [Streptomyces azureus]
MGTPPAGRSGWKFSVIRASGSTAGPDEPPATWRSAARARADATSGKCTGSPVFDASNLIPGT